MVADVVGHQPDDEPDQGHGASIDREASISPRRPMAIGELP